MTKGEWSSETGDSLRALRPLWREFDVKRAFLARIEKELVDVY
jgi:hypothetical protein